MILKSHTLILFRKIKALNTKRVVTGWSLSILIGLLSSPVQALTDRNCVNNFTGKFAACLRETAKVYVGVIKRLQDGAVVGTVGYSASDEPSLECLHPRFVKTKFQEEVALFDCAFKEGGEDEYIHDFGMNLCGRNRKPGYVEEQNGHIPFPLFRSTRLQLSYTLSGTNNNELNIQQSGGAYHFKFKKSIQDAHYIDYAPDQEGILQSDYIQVTFVDGSIRYLRGAFEHFYAPNGHMSPNRDELCLNP